MHSHSDRFRPLSGSQQETFFLKSLDHVYCAKSHLQERLPEIAPLAGFTDLLQAIDETLDKLNQQIIRMDKLFDQLAAQPELAICANLVAMLDAAFDAIQEVQSDPRERDLAILFYLGLIEGIELASFKLLKLAIPQQHVSDLRQLLAANADAARDELTLWQYLTKLYFS